MQETLSSGVKRPAREADPSIPSSAKVKKGIQLHLYIPIRHPILSSARTNTNSHTTTTTTTTTTTNNNNNTKHKEYIHIGLTGQSE